MINFGVYSSCCKITIKVNSKLPAIIIKTRYGLGNSSRKNKRCRNSLTHLIVSFPNSVPFDFLVGCCSFSSIPSRLNCRLNTRCFICAISTWSLEAVNWTSFSCLCSSLISSFFLSSDIFVDSFSVFSSLNRSFVTKSSDHVLLRCSLLAISRWSSNLLLLSYAKNLQLSDVVK